MRFYWLHTGLGIEPENPHEANLLNELAKLPLKWGRSEEQRNSGPGESTAESGGQGLFEVNQQIDPPRLSGQRYGGLRRVEQCDQESNQNNLVKQLARFVAEHSIGPDFTPDPCPIETSPQLRTGDLTMGDLRRLLKLCELK